MVNLPTITINEYYDSVLRSSKADIASKTDEYLLGVNAEELANFYLDKHQLPFVERDNNREIQYKKEKSVYRTLGDVVIDREIPIRIFYPIVLRTRIRTVIESQSQTYFPGYKMYIEEAFLVVHVFLSSRGTNQEQTIKTALETLEKAIEYKNSNVLAGNERLKNELTDFINQKKKQLEADEKLLNEIIKKVPVNLEKKVEKTSTLNLTVKEVIKPVYPKAQELQEPFIEAEKVNAVIELLESSGFSFETTPKVYSKMEEEELRDILLLTP